MVQIPTFTRTPNGSGVVTNESDVAAIQRALAEVALSSEPAFTNFADHAVLASANVPDAITRISVGGHWLVADDDGVAGTSNGGARTWSPEANPAHLGAFGITGTLHGAKGGASTSAHYMATPATDEGAAIQAAFNWALEFGRSLRGDPARVYGTTQALVWGATSTVTTVPDSCILEDFNVAALAHATNWWAGSQTGNAPSAWNFGQAVLTIGNNNDSLAKTGVSARNIRVDGRRIAPVCLWVRGLIRSHLTDVYTERATEAECAVGSKGNVSAGTFLAPAGDGAKTTDVVITRLTCKHFAFAEQSNGSYGTNDGTGHYGLTGRTSRGLVVSGADLQLVEPMLSTGLNCFVLRHSFNVVINGGRIWSGAAESNAATTAVIVAENCYNWQFNGAQISQGAVKVRGFRGGFIGCTFKQYTAAQQIQLVATESAETAAQFRMVGCLTDEDDGDLVTDGGTWGTFGGTLAGNVKSDGTAFAIS